MNKWLNEGKKRKNEKKMKRKRGKEEITLYQEIVEGVIGEFPSCLIKQQILTIILPH